MVKNLFDVESQLQEAEFKALDSLSRYKFMQFGYWAAIWVHLKHMSDRTHSSPFTLLVRLAKELKLERNQMNDDWKTIRPLTPYIGLDGKPVRCSDCDHLRDLITQGKASMMPAKCYPVGGSLCSFINSLCACVDTNARQCFEKRYPDRKFDDIYEPYEKCGCSCHDKEDEGEEEDE